MSVFGTKRTFRDRVQCPLLRVKQTCPMSAIPPKADIVERRCNVRFVPKADIHRYSNRDRVPSRSSVEEKDALEASRSAL
jgi:hypothetical protein